MSSFAAATMHRPSFPRARNFSGHGPRSLVSMCTRVLALNIDETCATDIKELPYRILENVWSEIQLINGRRETLPLDSWVTISEALRDSHDYEKTLPLELYRHRETIKVPIFAKLPTYMRPLFKLGTDYLVSLKIDYLLGLDTPELIALAGLRNLDSLDIIENWAPGERNVLTDRLVRAWSEVTDAFPALTFLRLRPGCARSMPTLTTRSLEYISTFPRLRVFDIAVASADNTAFERMHEQDSCGWECISSSIFFRHPADRSRADNDPYWQGNTGERTTALGGAGPHRLANPYIDYLPSDPAFHVYEETGHRVIFAPPTGDANPPPRVRVSDELCCRMTCWDPTSPGHYEAMAARGTNPPETHYQAFWRCALMDSAPPLWRGPSSTHPEHLVLPAKPHVSVILSPEDDNSLRQPRYYGNVYILHRRAKLPPSGRRLIREVMLSPSIMELSWLQLEEALALSRAEADELIWAKNRKREEWERSKITGKRTAGEQAAANARLARHRRKLGVRDMGDLFKGMQKDQSG